MDRGFQSGCILCLTPFSDADNGYEITCHSEGMRTAREYRSDRFLNLSVLTTCR